MTAIDRENLLLQRRNGRASTAHLVYTSAGDCANIERWAAAERSFDVWISYYGEHSDRFANVAEYYETHRGAKFPALARNYARHRHLFERYESILVIDDDLIISAPAIEHLFATRRAYDLWILQPAFSPLGCISHAITTANADTRLRFTNFVEVGCPLFRRDKLEAFLAVYDPSVICCGVDWWFCETVGGADEHRIAISDEVTCINPFPREKGLPESEINRVQSPEERRRAWERVKLQHHLRGEDAGFRLFEALPRSGYAKHAARLELGMATVRRKLRTLRHRLGRQG